MKFWAILLLLSLAGVAFTQPPAPSPGITLAGLLDEMADLTHLAEFPDPPFVTRQFSSFERSSDTPEEPATWFANHDRGFCYYEATITEGTPVYREAPQAGQAAMGMFSKGVKVGLARNKLAQGDFVWVYAADDPRQPGERRLQGFVPRSALTMNAEGPVLAEMAGPGCLVHLWSANPGDGGRLKIYLDHSPTPLVDAPAAELLGGLWLAEVPGRRFVPFPPPLAGERGRGFNLYFPIPYAKHCKIVAEKPGLAYHVVYRTYAADAAVTTFTWADLLRLQPQVEELRRLHLEPCLAKPSYPDAAAQTWAPQPIRLAPGGSHDAIISLKVPQPAAVVAQQWKLEPLTPDTLRHLHLQIGYDDERTPAVAVPFGEFFGTTSGVTPFTSLPCSITADGRLQAFWVMPFKKLLRLTLKNDGPNEVTLTPVFRVVARPWTPRSIYFHAQRQVDEVTTRPFRDLTRCMATGRGQFVGLHLTVENPSREWWGEGDEKITVDGEPFPSWFGTGTDDYFGAAWADRVPFQHAYHGRTLGGGPEHQGTSSLYRFHLLDVVPFTKSLRFGQELHHWNPRVRVKSTSVAYWYARSGV